LMERTGLSRSSIQRMMLRGMPYEKYESGYTAFEYQTCVDWMSANGYAPSDIISKLKRRHKINKRVRKPRVNKT
jgi:predicted nucleic acid-binding protein